MDQTSVFHGTTSNPPMAKAKLNWGGGCCCKNDSKWHEVLQFFNSIRHLAEAQPPTTEMARDQLIGFSFFVDALPTAPSSILSRRERAFHYGGRRYTRPDGPEMGGIDNRENQHHLNGFSFFFCFNKVFANSFGWFSGTGDENRISIQQLQQETHFFFNKKKKEQRNKSRSARKALAGGGEGGLLGPFLFCFCLFVFFLQFRVCSFFFYDAFDLTAAPLVYAAADAEEEEEEDGAEEVVDVVFRPVICCAACSSPAPARPR